MLGESADPGRVSCEGFSLTPSQSAGYTISGMDLGAIGRRHRTGGTLRYAMWVVITLLVGMLAIHATTTKWSDSVALAVANLVTATAFGVTAWLLTAEKQYPNAKLFGATAALWVIDSVKTSSLGPLPAVSWIIGPLVMAAGATVMLRYPSTHLHRGERHFLIGLAAWIVIGRTAWVLTVNPATLGDPPSVWWPTVFHDPVASGYVETVFDAGCIIFAVVFIVMVVRRLRRAKGIDRRMLLPVAVAAIAAGAAVGMEMLGRITVRGQPIYDTVLMVEAIALSAIPFAFLASTIRRQLAAVRGADIVLRLGGHSSVESVRDGLREALADPDLDILYWVPESATYVTSEGRDCPIPPANGPHQLAVPLHTADGSPLAVVMTSLTAERHRGAVDLAAAASGLALHNARLQAELLAELQQVQQSGRGSSRPGSPNGADWNATCTTGRSNGCSALDHTSPRSPRSPPILRLPTRSPMSALNCGPRSASSGTSLRESTPAC